MKSLFVCLSVCLLATLLRKFLTDFDEIFKIARQWYKEQLIKFWGWSSSPFRCSTGKCKMLHFWQCHMGVLSNLKVFRVTESRDVYWRVSGTVQAESCDQVTLLWCYNQIFCCGKTIFQQLSIEMCLINGFWWNLQDSSAMMQGTMPYGDSKLP